MSDIDPTPGTPVTLGDRLAWLRGDVTANQLATLAELAALRGTPPTTLAALAAQLAALRGVNNATLSTLLTESQFDTTMALVLSRLLDIEERIDKLQSAVGAVPYESLELASVRGLLNALVQQSTISRYGAMPAVPTEISSSDEVLGMGRVYAQFTPPIPGVVVAGDGVNLTAPWGDGWEAYIQTADPLPQINTDPSFPNRWISLDYVGAINFSVAPAYSIKVYLRAPVLYGTCYPATGLNNVSTSWALVWSGAPWAMTTMPANPTRPVFIQWDLIGWSFVNNSGVPATVYGWSNPYNGSLAINEVVNPGGRYVWSYMPSYSYFEVGGNYNAGDFAICEPPPS